MRNDDILTQDFIKELFEYRDGSLIWKKKKNKGKIAGYLRPPLYYRYIGINGKYYLAHRLIFLYHYGYIPFEVDHINGQKDDNRIENLRQANRSQQIYNTNISSKNTSGVKGVSYYTSCKRWYGKITVAGQIYRKSFDDKLKAENWVKYMRRLHHGEFAKF